jgi:hypothetical protein
MRSETRTQEWFLNDPRTRKWIVQCAGCGLYGRRGDTPSTIPKVNFETMFPIMNLNDEGICENCGQALPPKGQNSR